MEKKKSLAAICLGVLLLTPGACSLNPEIELNLTEKDIIHYYNNTMARCTQVYSYIPDGFAPVGGAMMAAATDEAEFTSENSSIHKFNTGSWNALDNPDGSWGNLWRGIRAANVFLESKPLETVQMDYYRLDPNESVQAQYKTRLENIARWEYEVRFLRAYFYSELIKRYGGVPIIKRSYSLEDNFAGTKRATLQQCIDFIVDECDAAAEGLPLTYGDSDLGRATKGAALALKSRVLLWAASDLWNDVAWDAGYPNTSLVTTDPTYGDQMDFYDDAAAAALEVINLTGAGYRLSNDWPALFGPNGHTNAEVIFARRNGNSNSFETTNYPIGYDRGQSGVTPTQDLVDAFETASGKAIGDAGSGYDKDNPFAGRDPRLAWTVLTNNTTFKGRPVEAWSGGRDGSGVTNATKTGYYLRKYVNENLNLLQGQSSIHTWIVIRLAEIYLNYAEAMNEAYGPTDDHGYGLSALQAVNAVRRRVNMPGIPEGTSQAALRERIRNERRVELAFEDFRFWDVRRWLIAEETLDVPVHGTDINRRGGLFEYDTFELETRRFDAKMYFYPIPQSEINMMGWPQNPLW